jgi:hypothetical protein
MSKDHLSLFRILFDRFLIVGHTMNEVEISMTLTAFAKVHFKWNHLTSSQQSELLGLISVKAGVLNGRALVNCLHSLSKMDVKWSDFCSSDLQTKFLNRLVVVSPSFVNQTSSMCVYSLGNMGLDFTGCCDVVHSKLFDIAFKLFTSTEIETGQHISNVLIGLSSGCVERRDLSAWFVVKMMDCLEHNAHLLSDQQLANSVNS